MKKNYSKPDAKYLEINTGDIMEGSQSSPLGPGTGNQGGGAGLKPGDI